MKPAPPPAARPPRVVAAAAPPRRSHGPLPLHPLLFAAFPLLSLYAHNLQETPLVNALRPAAAILAGLIFIWLLARAGVRDSHRAALVVSVLAFAFFSYGHLLSGVMEQLPWITFFEQPNRIFFPIWLLLVAAAVWGLLRMRANGKRGENLTAILNVAAAALVAFPLLTIAQGALRGQIVVRPPSFLSSLPKTQNAAAPADPNRPDIYYIILDAYGRADSLKAIFGYDNTPFLSALEKRGFFVAKKSRANYCMTLLALPCALNMHYLDDLARQQGAGSDNVTPLLQRIDNNAVAQFLEQRGYRYLRIETDDEVTGEDREAAADVVLAGRYTISPFEGLMLATTPLVALPMAQETQYAQHRARLLSGFERLEAVTTLPGPKFVFTHILAPHPPFVFGPNGEPRDSRAPFSLGDANYFRGFGRSQDTYRKRYPDQLAFINRKTLEAVDTILARSKTRPIVILQGDHGSRMTLDWSRPLAAQTHLREPFSNLTAIYTPDGGAGYLYDGISPVNTFRVLLGHFFHTDTPRLPDRSFYSTDQRMYDFTEVTQQLDSRAVSGAF